MWPMSWSAVLQGNFNKYGDGAGFVSADLAKSIVSAGPKNQGANGIA